MKVVKFVVYKVGKYDTLCATTCQLNCRKIMFSVVFVHHSVHGGSHVTVTNDALDLTIQGPPGHGASLYRVVVKTGDLFKFVQ